MDAEAACVMGDLARAQRDLDKADAHGLYDLAWIDRCPAIAPLRDAGRLVGVRARIAERAERARAAYVAGT